MTNKSVVQRWTSIIYLLEYKANFSYIKFMIKYIISVSRRTDIPAFFSEWFINRLKDGFAYYKNPFRNEYVYVSLKSADIIGFVFWSKNFSPLLSKLESIEKISKNLFFHFTITGLPNDIEINVPPPSETLKDLFI